MGMILLDDYLFALYRKGTITGDMALERAMDHPQMEQKLLAVAANEDDEEEGDEDAPSDEF